MVAGSSCSIASCHNTGRVKKYFRSDLMFHRFPKDPDLRNEWIKKCGRQRAFSTVNATVCSDHFTPEDYRRNLQAELLGRKDAKKLLNLNAVPHIKLPPNVADEEYMKYLNSDRKLNEDEKIAQRKALVEEAIKWAESLPSSSFSSTVTSENLLEVQKPLKIEEKGDVSRKTSEVQAIQSIHSEFSKTLNPLSAVAIGTTKSDPNKFHVLNSTASTLPSTKLINRKPKRSIFEKNLSLKFTELQINYGNLRSKYTRCFKALCRFKAAYGKLRHQNDGAKLKIIELRNKCKNLQLQLRKRCRKHKQVQTNLNFVNDGVSDVTRW